MSKKAMHAPKAATMEHKVFDERCDCAISDELEQERLVKRQVSSITVES